MALSQQKMSTGLNEATSSYGQATSPVLPEAAGHGPASTPRAFPMGLKRPAAFSFPPKHGARLVTGPHCASPVWEAVQEGVPGLRA